MSGDDQIRTYFFSEYSGSSAGSRVNEGSNKQKLVDTFTTSPPRTLVELCIKIDLFVRNERNYNLHDDPFKMSTQVSTESLELGYFFGNLPESTPEKNRLKTFLSYYFQCLADNRPFADDDTAGAYLERFRAQTQMAYPDEHPSMKAFRIVCAFSLLLDLVAAIAYTSGLTDVGVNNLLHDMQIETERLKKVISDFIAENDSRNIPEILMKVLKQLAEDTTNFPNGAYTYYLDSRADNPKGKGLDGLMSEQIRRFNARVSQRDLGLMAMTYKKEIPGNILEAFSWRLYQDNFWCLARRFELCDGNKVIPSVEIIIAFRGSWSVQDWLTDFKIWPVAYEVSDSDNQALVHSGFHQTLNAHWTEISSFINKVKVDTKTNTSSWKFRVAGHSLGASWARLAAIKIALEHKPIHKIHLNLAAYPGVFHKARAEDARKETLIIRNYYIKGDIIVTMGSTWMIRDLPAWEVTPKLTWFWLIRYLPVPAHFIFNIDEVMAKTGDEAPRYTYMREHGFTKSIASTDSREQPASTLSFRSTNSIDGGVNKLNPSADTPFPSAQT